MRRKLICSLCFVSMVFLLFMPICATAQDTIKLAVVEPFSGTFKDIADRYTQGIIYAAKVINESGGLLGKKVEVIQIDNEMKPDVATRKAQAAILKDGVKFLMCGSGSSIGAALSQLAEKMNVITISFGAEAASLTGEKCNRNFFRTCANTDTHSYALAYMIAKKGYKNVGLIAQDYSFGKEAMAAFKRKLSQISPSTKIVAEIYHPMQTKDYAPYVTQMLSAKPDAIFTTNWGNDLRIMLKQGRTMGMKQKVFGYFMNDEVTVQAFGNEDHLILGDMGTEIYTITIPTKKNQEFVAKFYKDMGFYPTWLRGKTYMATMFWAEAVKKAGSTDVNAVIKAWEGLTYDGPAGLWTMRACDHQNQIPFWAFEFVKDNKFFKHAYIGPSTKIDPKEVSTPCGGETGCKMKK